MSTTRHGRTRRLAQGFSTGVLLLLLPAAALAQSASTRVPTTARAEDLHLQADQLLETSQIASWPDAAGLLAQAAAQRAADDVAAVGEWAIAGELYHFTGSLSRAQASLEHAAERALANGQVLESARNYLKAAVVANERGRNGDAVKLARSAERLARSPHLTPAECDCILGHIVWLPNERVAIQ
jgi:hypothetical protein